MINVHASDLDASMEFYRHLGFAIHADDRDGEDHRCLRLIHARSEVLLNLRSDPRLLRGHGELGHPEVLRPVLFTLVIDDWIDWQRRLEHAGVHIEERVSQPWGVWLHFRDPAGNLIRITTTDMY